MRQYILTLLPNYTEAEDVLAETNMRIWEQFDELDEPRDFRAWACTIAYYQVLTWRKRRGRQRLVFDDALVKELSARSESAAERTNARHEALLTCLSEVSERSRSLLAKVYRDGRRVKDVASEMGRTAESLYKVVQRLRVTLRDCIEQRLAEAGR